MAWPGILRGLVPSCVVRGSTRGAGCWLLLALVLVVRAKEAVAVFFSDRPHLAPTAAIFH
jgi:hypothetical protein